MYVYTYRGTPISRLAGGLLYELLNDPLADGVTEAPLSAEKSEAVREQIRLELYIRSLGLSSDRR